MVLPYKESASTKKEQVATMFNNIAHKYDFLNHFLSMGIDKLWRKRSVKIVKKYKPQSILDIATGTGDFAIAAYKIKPARIIGVDISDAMLACGREKIQKKGYQNIITLENGDSENLRFANNEFDAITVAFGVRNFENLHKGLTEMFRVLKPNGVALVLEFSKPKSFPFKQLYWFYFTKILPSLGKLFSKDASAYTYLPESVNEFPDGNLFLNELQKAGFQNTKAISLSFGIATIYVAEK